MSKAKLTYQNLSKTTMAAGPSKYIPIGFLAFEVGTKPHEGPKKAGEKEFHYLDVAQCRRFIRRKSVVPASYFFGVLSTLNLCAEQLFSRLGV